MYAARENSNLYRLAHPSYGRRAARFIKRNPVPVYGAAGAMLAIGAKALVNRYMSDKSKARNAVPVQVVSQRKVKKAKPKKKKSLKGQIKQLQKSMNKMTSILTYRAIDVARVLTSQNEANYTEFPMNENSVIEDALAQTRFFDPSNPGTLITANSATGTYQRSYEVSSYQSLRLKNNYQVPCMVKIYKYKLIADTNNSVSTLFTAGLVDIGNPSAVSPAVYPTDTDLISDMWKLESTTSYLMKPGAEKSYSVGSKPFSYDPSDVDSHQSTYQRGYNSMIILIRIQGVPSHDKTTTTQAGIAACGLDIYRKRTLTIKYDSGGADLKTVYISNSLDTQTAGPVVSQVVVDNQEYSAS